MKFNLSNSLKIGDNTMKQHKNNVRTISDIAIDITLTLSIVGALSLLLSILVMHGFIPDILI